MPTASSLSSELSSIPPDEMHLSSSPSASSTSSDSTPRPKRPSPRRSPTRYRQIRRVAGKKRLQPFDKLRETLYLWRKQRFTFKEFLRAWLLSDEHHGSLGRATRVGLFRELLEEEEIREVLGHHPSSRRNWQPLLKELDGLTEYKYFDTFDPDTAHEWDIDLEDVRKVIKTRAPEWYSCLDLVLRNCRSQEPDQRETLSKGTIGQMYTMTAVACRSRKRNTSSVYAKKLGLYMISSGTKRRVVDTVAGLGLTDTYQSINEDISDMALKAKAG
ncbi:hypothetical protein P152DRAFT_516647 [Eremomyces bilateralis CBS 781.70]|uniref:Uncharacterized protein n=1 Tax=Eremomyces bilateralis CBS 781.70 TaxID=1392243 RepID=A0A6G1FUL0_9PEZI|nr:uncharacterized protein P152DRAFT_516647 [Eremomyces bilateralis CBS 781.70]KAF1809464.1 hypothetical protein P152DRAFT_516647 [Eremomyces bilateralis CBS 781.70]